MIYKTNNIDTSILHPDRVYIFACNENGDEITNISYLKKLENRHDVLSKSIEKLIQSLQKQCGDLTNTDIDIEIVEKDSKLKQILL